VPSTSESTPPPQKSRRNLRFSSVDDALAEAMRLAATEQEGTLSTAGKWSLGQALGHLATWANFALDGYPASVHPPMIVRLIARLLKNRVINKGMPPGMKIGRVPGGTLGTEQIPTELGLSRFGEAMERLRRTAPSEPNPACGPLTHDQWIQLNLRHAELHLGFFVPRSET
jgi:hypothetical protein